MAGRKTLLLTVPLGEYNALGEVLAKKEKKTPNDGAAAWCGMQNQATWHPHPAENTLPQSFLNQGAAGNRSELHQTHSPDGDSGGPQLQFHWQVPKVQIYTPRPCCHLSPAHRFVWVTPLAPPAFLVRLSVTQEKPI